MVWSDEQIKKWANNYRADFDTNKKMSNSISTFACVLNLILVILLICEPKLKVLCPFVWSADLIMLYYDCKYTRLIWFPIKTLDKVVCQMDKLMPLAKDKTKEEILQSKKMMKQLKKTMRLLNKYEKFMRKNYEKN